MDAEASRGRGAVRLAVAAGLLAATAAVYGQVVRFDFINLDDARYVYENNPVRAGLTLDSLWWAFTTDHAGNWHPLTWLSLMLDVTLFGVDPGALHATNVLLHALNTLLLFLLLERVTGALFRSGLVAALFAVHPLHVESVAWIAERKDVLSTLFWLGATWTWVSYVRSGSRRAYGGTLGLFALGLMAKPMLVTLPFALLLWDVWPLARVDFRQALAPSRAWPLVREKWPLFALSLGSIAITLAVQVRAPLAAVPLSMRVENAVVAYARYLGRTLWPSDPRVFYPYVHDWPAWQVAGSLALVVALTVGAVLLWRRAAYVLSGWLFFVGTLVPTIGLVQVGGQSIADRYTYVPLIGIFWLAVWGVHDLARRWSRAPMVLGVVAGVVLAGLAVRAHLYVVRWQDAATLFSYVTEVDPDNFLARERLGETLVERGELDAAVVHLERAIQIRPTLWRSHMLIGEVHEQRGDLARAERAYRNALSVDDQLSRVLNRLGRTLAKQGRLDEAVQAFRSSAEIDPDDPESRENLGIVAEMTGSEGRAIEYFRAALEREPGFLYSRRRLGWLLATSHDPDLRNGPESVALFEGTCERTRFEDASDLDGFAAAYAEAGRFAEAEAMARRAAAVARKSGNGFQERLSAERAALYASGQPLRLP